MKNNSKRICALLLAIVMCITCVVPVFAESSDAHLHSEAATCPGADAEHYMTNCTTVFVKTVAPKCGVFGYDLYECTTCKAPVVTNWTELGDGTHAFGQWSVETKPTCTDYGVMKRVCTNGDCGEVETINAANFAEKTAAYGADVTKVIKPLDHKNADGTSAIKNDKRTDLECKDGIPAYKEWCELCDYEKEISATAGQNCDRYVAQILVQPNCYETGLALVKCHNCSYEAKEVIVNATNSGLGHKWVKVGDFTVAPTCGTAGSGNVECSVCQATAVVTVGKVTVSYIVGGETKTEEIVIDAFKATGIHDFSVDVGPTAPDCDDDGVLAHKKCSTCDAVSIDGVKESAAADIVDPAKGHTWDDVEAVAHECEKDGVKAHFICTVCSALSFNKTDIVTATDIVDPAKHDYDLTDPVATSKPSCTKYGFWFYGCGVCGQPSNVTGDTSATDAPVPSTAPEGSEWVSNGVLRLPRLPHDMKLDATDSRNVAGDCVTDKVEVYKCSCGAEEIKTTKSSGHDWVTITVKANCQHGGYKFDYCKSSICGWTDADADGIVDIDECETIRIDSTTNNEGKYDIVPVQPDLHEWDPAKTVITTTPTCTDKGIALDWCVFCGASEYHAVDALGHNTYKYVDTIPATCTTAGKLVYSCDRCGGNRTELDVADLTDKHENYATNKTLDLAALGHSYVGVTPAHTPATCSSYGYDVYNCVRYDVCKVQNTVILDSNNAYIYPALNHTYPAGHADAGKSSLYLETTLPTCDKNSSDPLIGIAGCITEKCYQCNYSSKVEDLKFEHDNAKHHPNSIFNVDTKWHNGVEYADAAAADAAAVAAGATEANGIYWPGSCDRPKLVDYYCPTCERQFYAADYSMVGDHAPKSGTEVDYKAPDCENAGNYAHYVCEKCDKKVLINADGDKVVYGDDSAVVIPSTGHTWTDVQGKAPDCVNSGAKAYSYCACGAYTLDKTVAKPETFTQAELADKIFIKANGHAWGTIIPEVPAKCDKAGVKAYYDCANCDALSLDADKTCAAADLVIPAINHKGHMVDSKRVYANCLEAGYQYHYCTLCNYEYVDNYEYAKGHTFDALVNKDEPECESTGFEAYYACSVCNKKFVTNEKFNADDKSNAELTIPATGIHVNAAGGTILDKCTDAAEDRFCVGCQTKIAATHTSLQTNDVDASCTEYGYTVEYCEDCKYEKVTKKPEFAPTGHNYQWVVTTPAQMYVGGVESYKCVAGNGSKGCGHIADTRATAPLGGIEFSYKIDNAIVSGAEYVNGGKIKLTISYKAANVDLANIAIRLNYNADVLTFVSGDFKCDAVDAEGNKIFDINNAAIGGKTAGFVYVTAKTTGFGELAADKKLNGEGIFAEIYFDINKDVVAGSTIGFDIALDGNSASAVLEADGDKVYANFGSVKSETTKALADIDIDGKYNNADEVEFLDIAFGNKYVAAADINQDGLIGLDDYGFLFDLLLGNINYEELCAAAQSK